MISGGTPQFRYSCIIIVYIIIIITLGHPLSLPSLFCLDIESKFNIKWLLQPSHALLDNREDMGSAESPYIPILCISL